MLSFDQVTHTYRDGRRVLPSVTEILREMGIYGSYQFAESHHKYRGSAVHAGSAILDAGGTPQLGAVPAHLQSVADDIVNGYWPAFSAWRSRTGFRGRIWECPYADPVLGYAGCFDTAGEVGDEIWFVDLKSGTLPEMVPVQLWAYEHLIRHGKPINQDHPGLPWLLDAVNSGRRLRKKAVRLEKTGRDTMTEATSKGQPYDDPTFSAAWKSCLNLYNLKTGYNLLGERR